MDAHALRILKGIILLLMITYMCIPPLEFLVNKSCRITKFVLYGAKAVQYFDLYIFFFLFQEILFPHMLFVLFFDNISILQ